MEHIKRLIVPILLLAVAVIMLYIVGEVDRSPLTILLLIPIKFGIVMTTWHITRKTYLKDYDVIDWDAEKLDSKSILSLVMLICITWLATGYA